MGPLYGHVFHDAVSGFRLKANYPLVAEWVTRTMAQNALNARPFGAVIYEHVEGALVGAPAASDGAEFLAGDEVPETLLPVLTLWFGEFWPVLEATIKRFTEYFASPEWEAKAATNGGLLPGKTFAPSPGFEAEQSGDGPLMHTFQVGGVAGRRMCSGYHLWMLGRLETVLEGFVEQAPCGSCSGRSGDRGCSAWAGAWPAAVPGSRTATSMPPGDLIGVQRHRQLCKLFWRTEARSWSGT